MTATQAMQITAAVPLAVAGDETAFARIVAAYHGDMLRVAYGICGDRDLAQDAVQAAWLVAWRKLSTLRDADRLRPWLVAVAANEARHVVRRQRAVVEIDLDHERHDPQGPDADDPPGDIRRVDLVNAVQRLKPDERSLLALRYGADLDSSEIGPLLGLSASGVRARLARLMGRLRKELADE